MNKYRNHRTVVGSLKFDSKREANRWGELLLLQRAGEIKDLARQVVLPIDIRGEHICNYIADFQYYEKTKNWPHPGEAWTLVVEDSKGVKTRDYVLKRKLVKAIYGIKILET